MTGMPSSLAFLIAGRIASESMARMIRTLAPFEIRLSTSVSCLVGEPCASAEMYLSPAASSAPLIAASSVFQRSSWNFDQETPTATSFAGAARDMTPRQSRQGRPKHRVFSDFIDFLPETATTADPSRAPTTSAGPLSACGTWSAARAASIAPLICQAQHDFVSLACRCDGSPRPCHIAGTSGP